MASRNCQFTQADFVSSSARDTSESEKHNSSSLSAVSSDLPKLPYGHCAVHLRWRGASAVISETSKYFTLHYTDEIPDYVDFLPSHLNIVSILTEAEIVCCGEDTDEIRKKFARIYKLANKNPRQCLQPMIIYHLTEVTQPFFFKIQTLCVMDFCMALTTVSSLDSVPLLLERIKVAARAKNPFKVERKKGNRNKDVLLVLMSVPGVREHHARTILRSFGSLSGVARARETELASLVGAKLARGIYTFLDRRNNV